jgi:hypothetical protein
MRETTVSIDDITIQSAKGKLATLAERTGYADAMAAPTPDSRTAQIVLATLSLAFGALAVACVGIDSVVLRVILMLLLGAATVFCVLAAIGSAPEPAPTIWGAAVIGESHEKREGELEAMHRIVLLDDKGAQHELTTVDSIAEALRIGDLGAAHVRNKTLVRFVRL